MKTQRRHELQTNKLADWLGQQIEVVRPHSRTIAGVVILVCVVGLAYLFITGRKATEAGSAWADFFGALADDDTEAFARVYEQHGANEAGFWALQEMADRELGRGIQLLYRDRSQAKEALEAAEKNYGIVIKNAKQGSLLESRAQYGMAQVSESLGKVDRAKEHYKMLADAAPDSAIGKEARSRFEALDKQDVERFYAWFEKQEPKPPAMPSTSSTSPLDLPGDLTDLPSRPDLSGFPSTTGPTDSAPTKEREPSLPTSETPKPEATTPPADSTPESTVPGDQSETEPAKDDASTAREAAADEKPTEDSAPDKAAPASEAPEVDSKPDALPADESDSPASPESTDAPASP